MRAFRTAWATSASLSPKRQDSANLNDFGRSRCISFILDEEIGQPRPEIKAESFAPQRETP